MFFNTLDLRELANEARVRNSTWHEMYHEKVQELQERTRTTGITGITDTLVNNESTSKETNHNLDQNIER